MRRFELDDTNTNTNENTAPVSRITFPEERPSVPAGFVVVPIFWNPWLVWATLVQASVPAPSLN